MGDKQLTALICGLIERGKTDKMILNYLKGFCGKSMSRSKLRVIMKANNINRGYHRVTDEEIQKAILDELDGPSVDYGYRRLKIALRLRYDINVSYERIRWNLVTMGLNRPFWMGRRFKAERKMKYCPGPNFLWALDGHNKLQAFGIYLHACIDVYSRKLIWLEASVTNRDSSVIAGYFVKAVREIKWAPEKVSSDYGLESEGVAHVQMALYAKQDDGGNIEFETNHFRRTYSVHNVAIESFWRTVQETSTNYWRGIFENLQAENIWNGCVVDRWALFYVFLPLIRKDLSRAADDHHSHTIRTQKDRIRPGGTPEDIYLFPEVFGGRHYGKPVDDETLDEAASLFGVDEDGRPEEVPPDVHDAISSYLVQNELAIWIRNAKEVYIVVRAFLRNIVGDADLFLPEPIVIEEEYFDEI